MCDLLKIKTMKRKLLIVLGIAIGIYFVSTIQFNDNNKIVSNEEIKALHKENLEKSPFKEQLKFTKKERIANSLPPNKYNEERWELTMNPELGRPTPENLDVIRKEREANQISAFQEGRVPGDAMDNGWVERGPNNVGGRTRALMFDPNDAADRTVFAGGVSGGLWKNSNISSASSVWTQVDFPEHVNVATITADPNNPSIFYVGTGESYVSGQVNGNGVWKSTDAGISWTKVLGGISGDSYFQSATSFTVNSPGSIAGDYLYLPTTNFGSAITSTITADIILANDSTGEPTEGCTDFGPSAIGKIAIIRRGECAFVDKVKNAQNNGAIAAIVMNNVAGDPIPMGGEDATITIPAIMISKADGDMLETALGSGNVNVSITPSTGDFTGVLVPGIQHIHDVKIKDNGGTSDIYVAAGDSFYQYSNATTYLGGPEFGLYKSSDGGTSWTELTLPPTANGNKYCPNDIEIDFDGTIWISTTNSVLFGDGGGTILKSIDNGATFTEVYTVADGDRTQIAVSSTAAGKVYVLAELAAGGVSILKTTSAFVPAFLVQTKALPNDADTNITATDFTRGQAFYDLMLEVSPVNDEVVYTGGIDLFKSINGATAWSQFSHWYGGFGYQEVHADQHILAFGNTDSNKILMGNDGGVYYSENGGTTTESRNNGYNTAQFYTVGVAPTTAFTGDYFAGGLQDNGTQLFENASQTGPDSTSEPYGGDGAYTFFDQDGTDQYFIRNYVYNSGINLYNYAGTNVTIENESASNGAFINPQALDSNLDILYSNYSAAGNFIVRRYSGIKSSGTLTKTELTDAALTTTPTAFTVSPYTTSSSKLLVGTVLGDVLLVENANGASPTWTGLDGNALVGSVSDLEFGQTENDIFVTMHNYGVNNIWYSNDGGTTWLAKDGDLPDVPVNTILQNPLNTEQVLIGTDLGVWYTEDFSSANPTWTSAFNGMSNTIVLDLDLRDDNMVFAATHGRGVFSGMFTADSLSVEEDELSNGINMYPTVSNGEFTVKAMQSFGNVDLNVYNINGQRVYSSKLELSNNTQQINLNLASGMYVAQFTVDNASVSKKIIIK